MQFSDFDPLKGKRLQVLTPDGFRPIGTLERNCCVSSSGTPDWDCDTPSVMTPPGAIMFTRMPSGATSRAKLRVNMSTPPLEAS